MNNDQQTKANHSYTTDYKALHDLLESISKDRMSLAVSSAAHNAKAEILVEKLDSNPVEEKFAAIEKQVNDDLDKAITSHLESLAGD